MDKETLEVVSQVGQALSNGGLHMYDVIVREALVRGAIGLVTCPLWIWGSYKLGMKSWNFLHDETRHSDSQLFIAVCTIAVCGLFVICGLLSMETHIRQLLNPEFYVIELVKETF